MNFGCDFGALLLLPDSQRKMTLIERGYFAMDNILGRWGSIGDESKCYALTSKLAGGGVDREHSH